MMWVHRKSQPQHPGQPLQSQAFLEFTNSLERFPLLAHHPACRHHHNHIIWVGKVPMCLGCTMITCGLTVGIILIPHLGIITHLPYYVLLTLGVILYIPAILQIWIQKKPYKMFARFLLGIAIAFLAYAGLWLTPFSVLGVILRIGFLTFFILVWRLTLKVRSTYSKSPCQNCPDGRFPVCSYTMHRVPKLARKYFAKSDGSDPEGDEFVKALLSVNQ